MRFLQTTFPSLTMLPICNEWLYGRTKLYVYINKAKTHYLVKYTSHSTMLAGVRGDKVSE